MKTFTANDIFIWPFEIKYKKHESLIKYGLCFKQESLNLISST